MRRDAVFGQYDSITPGVGHKEGTIRLRQVGDNCMPIWCFDGIEEEGEKFARARLTNRIFDPQPAPLNVFGVKFFAVVEVDALFEMKDVAATAFVDFPTVGEHRFDFGDGGIRALFFQKSVSLG